MKFEIDAKLLAKGLKIFMTKGKFTVNGSDGYNVTEANLYLTDDENNNIIFVGADNPGSVYVRMRLPGVVHKKGKLFIPDISEFYDYVSGLTGTVNIEYDNNKTIISNDKLKYDIVLFRESIIDEFDEWHNKAVLTEDGASYSGNDFNILFVTSEYSTLNDLYDMAYKRIGSDKFSIEFKNLESVCFTIENDTNNVVSVDIAADVYTDVGTFVSNIKYALPILKNLFDITSLYMFTTDDGNNYFWFESTDFNTNINLEWVVSNAE